MRKVFGYILAAAFLTLASCSKEQLAGEGSALQSGEPRIITLSFNPSTKTTPGGTEGRSPEFEDGDIIRLSNSTSWEERAVNVSDGVATVSTFLAGELKAVYPADAAATDANGLITGIKVQASQSGRFRDANICMTTIPANANSATLLNQTAVLRFYVDASIGVKSVTVTSGGSNIANEGAHLKQIIVDPAGNELISSVTDDPDRRLCYVAVLPGANTNALTFTSETTTQGTVVHKPLRTSVTLAANGMYNAFIPYYIKMKVNDSPETYQKWGYCNVGAFLPEDYGRYFAWGDTEGQIRNGSVWSGGGFNWEHYRFATEVTATTAKFTKYVPDGHTDAAVSPDNKLVLDAEDDAAYMNWGENWRIPTGGSADFAEFTVLVKACQPGYTTGEIALQQVASVPSTRGAYYYNETGKVPGVYFVDVAGNRLFFPAAGFVTNSDLIITEAAGPVIYCWSNTLNPDPGHSSSSSAHDFKFRNGKIGLPDASSRFHGFSVRAIYNTEKTADFNPYDDKGNI